MRFHIVSPAYNAAAFIEEMIGSVQSQTHNDFQHTIIDDLSTDDTAERAVRASAADPRITVLRNEHKLYSLGGYSRGIAESQPDDDEVVVILDGDDRLASSDVLSRLDQIYADPNCWFTYGSYAGVDGVRDKSCQPYNQSTIHHAQYRRRRCPVPHLRTFRYKLWKMIPPNYLTVSEEDVRCARKRALLRGRWRRCWHWRNIEAADLVDSSGRFTRRLSDKVPSYAMLEMAGRRARFVDQILLYYSRYERDLGFVKHARRSNEQRWYTRLIRDIIEHREPLAPIETEIDPDDSDAELGSDSPQQLADSA